MSTAALIGIVYVLGWLVASALVALSLTDRDVEFSDAAAGCFIATIWPLFVLVLPAWGLARFACRRFPA